MKTPAPTLLLDRQLVSELLTLDECIAAVEGAFADHAHGRVIGPGLLHVAAEREEFHIKTGGLSGAPLVLYNQSW